MTQNCLNRRKTISCKNPGSKLREQWKEIEHEKRKRAATKPGAKQMNFTLDEFFESLDFLVTFLAMKKVT